MQKDLKPCSLCSTLVFRFFPTEMPCFHLGAIISSEWESVTYTLHPSPILSHPTHTHTPTSIDTLSIPALTNLSVSGMADLLRLLLRVAEKAANVARVCRQEAPLFQLLVQEKTGDDKNKKFVQDFKTLADVVIQEMIRHDVGAKVRRGQGEIWTEVTVCLFVLFVLVASYLVFVFCSSFFLSPPPVPRDGQLHLRRGVQQV